MSSQPVRDVQKFHCKFGIGVRTFPGLIDSPTIMSRIGHLREEIDELEMSAATGDLNQIIDACVDIVYLAIGTAVQHGIDQQTWDECWDAVHGSNMAKHRVDGPGHKFGVVKPPGWQAPDIRKILKHARQLHLGPEFA